MLKKAAEKIKSFLLWSQRYVRTDMLYLAKGGFWLTFGQFAFSALALASTIVFANVLPKETYGSYKYVLSIVSILIIATLPQMSTAVTQAVARGFDGDMLAMIKPKLAWGALGSVAGAGLAGWYLLHGNLMLAAAFLVVAVILPAYGAFGLFDAFLVGRKLFDVSVKYAVMIQAISIGALIGTVLLTGSITVMLAVFFGSRTLLNVILFLRTRKRYAPNDRRDPGTEPYGKHMTLMSAIMTVGDSLDGILAYHFLGAAQLAVYAIAVGPPDQIKGLLSNIDTLAFPKFSERDEREIRAGMRRKFVTLFILGIVVIGAYIVAAPFLFGVVFPKYGASVFYSQLFSLSLLNVTFAPAATYLRAKKKIKEQYKSSVFNSLFQIVFMVVFVVKWGLLGLIVARILSRYAGMLSFLFYYYRTKPDIDEASPVPAVPS